MNRDLAATTHAEAVIELAEAAQRALAGWAAWAPADAVRAVREKLLPLWPEVSPAAVRAVICGSAGLAAANGVTSVPAPIASWPAADMLNAVHRSRSPGPQFGALGPAALASVLAFDESADAEVLEVLAVLLALAYAPACSQ